MSSEIFVVESCNLVKIAYSLITTLQQWKKFFLNRHNDLLMRYHETFQLKLIETSLNTSPPPPLCQFRFISVWLDWLFRLQAYVATVKEIRCRVLNRKMSLFGTI